MEAESGKKASTVALQRRQWLKKKKKKVRTAMDLGYFLKAVLITILRVPDILLYIKLKSFFSLGLIKASEKSGNMGNVSL